jgi:hypothetical protein
MLPEILRNTEDPSFKQEKEKEPFLSGWLLFGDLWQKQILFCCYRSFFAVTDPFLLLQIFFPVTDPTFAVTDRCIQISAGSFFATNQFSSGFVSAGSTSGQISSPSSCSCFSSTTFGASHIRSDASFTFGNAMTSRMESACTICITIRSSP